MILKLKKTYYDFRLWIFINSKINISCYKTKSFKEAKIIYLTRRKILIEKDICYQNIKRAKI